MSNDAGTPITLEVLGDVLFRGFLVGFAFLLLCFLAFVFFHEPIYTLHSAIFDITREAHTALIYEWIGNMKLLIISLFLIPWIAVRLTTNAR